jgi:site-specific DNA recombinase
VCASAPEAVARGSDDKAIRIDAKMVRAFTAQFRRTLLEEDAGFRRSCLRLLAQRVEVGDRRVRIMGSTTLARAVVNGSENPMKSVPIFVRGWRPRGDSNTRPTV